jgi:hypothetical protein
MLPAVHLRVLITGVRVKEARPYFLTLQARRRRASRGVPRASFEKSNANPAAAAAA